MSLGIFWNVAGPVWVDASKHWSEWSAKSVTWRYAIRISRLVGIIAYKMATKHHLHGYRKSVFRFKWLMCTDLRGIALTSPMCVFRMPPTSLLCASHIVAVACYRWTIAGLELIPSPFWLLYHWQCSRHTFRPIWTDLSVLSHSGKDVPTLSATSLQDLVEHVCLLKCRPVYDSVWYITVICPTTDVWSIDINFTFFSLPLSYI